MVLQVFKRFKFWDILIICITLVLSLSIFISLPKNKSGVIEISVNGEIYGTYPIYEDKTIDVHTKYGNLTVCVKKQRVSIKNSDCKDKECMNQKNITKKGQMLICLPLKVIVQIGGNEYEYAY